MAYGSANCDDCTKLDGTIWDEDDPRMPELPIHPNCECDYEEYQGDKESD